MTYAFTLPSLRTIAGNRNPACAVPVPGARIAMRALGPVAAVLASLSVMGCMPEELAGATPQVALVEPSQRHPILVSQKPTTLAISVPTGSSGLSPRARADLIEFAQHFRATEAGDSRLVILAPSGSANEIAAMNAVGQIRGLLGDYGYMDSSISVEAVDATAHSQPPIKVSYMRYVAEGPDCGHWPDNLAYQPDNMPMANLGCANQRNFAAMVANPADLLGPRSQTMRSSERRDVVWEKYLKGDQTASQKNEDGRVYTRAQGSN